MALERSTFLGESFRPRLAALTGPALITAGKIYERALDCSAGVLVRYERTVLRRSVIEAPAAQASLAYDGTGVDFRVGANNTLQIVHRIANRLGQFRGRALICEKSNNFTAILDYRNPRIRPGGGDDLREGK